MSVGMADKETLKNLHHDKWEHWQQIVRIIFFRTRYKSRVWVCSVLCLFTRKSWILVRTVGLGILTFPVHRIPLPISIVSLLNPQSPQSWWKSSSSAATGAVRMGLELSSPTFSKLLLFDLSVSSIDNLSFKTYLLLTWPRANPVWKAFSSGIIAETSYRK